MSIVWFVFSLLFALALVTGALYFVSNFDGHKMEKVAAISTLVKIFVGLVQILTQVEFTLELRWPPMFAWLVNLLKVFSFDFLAFIDIGCVADYTFYDKFAIAIFMIPGFLAITYGIYIYRKDVVGIANQTSKMGFAVIFLSYPFVSTSMFQGLSCRQLDQDEEWLSVDMQIDCLSTSYSVFRVMAAVGICAYPLGIPVMTLYTLVLNRDGVRSEGSDTYARFEFLVGDYKPDYYYWDALEMLRKVLVTGMLMFVSRGSMFQLLVGLVICLIFLFASAWLQPFKSEIANIFKSATEFCLVLTLALCVMSKVDLEMEDVSEDVIGALLLGTNTVLPLVALVAAIWLYGIEANEVDENQVEEPKEANAIYGNPMHGGMELSTDSHADVDMPEADDQIDGGESGATIDDEESIE